MNCVKLCHKRHKNCLFPIKLCYKKTILGASTITRVRTFAVTGVLITRPLSSPVMTFLESSLHTNDVIAESPCVRTMLRICAHHHRQSEYFLVNSHAPVMPWKVSTYSAGRCAINYLGWVSCVAPRAGPQGYVTRACSHTENRLIWRKLETCDSTVCVGKDLQEACVVSSEAVGACAANQTPDP